MPWYEDDDEDIVYYDEAANAVMRIFGIYYDPYDKAWKCHCPKYKHDGACRHLQNLKKTIDVEVEERYL